MVERTDKGSFLEEEKGMSIFENTVMIQRETPLGTKIFIIFVYVMTAVMFLGGLLLNPIIFTVPFVLMCVASYFAKQLGEIEYEYTYIEGELDIDRIRAAKRRKSIAKIDMEDLLVIAPEGSSEIANYERDESAKRVDCSSLRKEVKKYKAVYKAKNGISIITFEPDENLLDKMRMRNARKIFL